jgi:transposase
MAGKLLMGKKELARSHLMERVKTGDMTLKNAAIHLGVSYRQAKRIHKRYCQEGAAGLLHKNQGKASNNRIASEQREAAIQAYKQRYHDFGPTFASEKLAEHEGIIVSAETLRQWLLSENLWHRQRRRNPYRSRRDRKECFGELVQFDGSHHDWFEGRRGKCCLMNMVDDAEGRSLAMLFEQETTGAAMTLLSCWIRKYGIPQALYGDRKNAYVSNREPSIQEQLAGIEPQSHFESACEKLGIQVIKAYSPQAKGRVERSHGVYQDRFVKELRLAGICTIAEANRFLEETYLPAINAKFVRPAACPEDAHIPLGDADLYEIMCFEETRGISRDFIVSFERRLFQILPGNHLRPRPGDKVTVRVRLDKTLDLYFRGTKLSVKEIDRTTKKEAA